MFQMNRNDHLGKRNMEDLQLLGCFSRSLLDYLKSIGLFKIISEQLNQGTRSYWEDDTFHIVTDLDKEGIIDFLISDYVPTPVLVPWSGSDFFETKKTRMKDIKSYSEPPTKSDLIKAYLSTDSARIDEYRRAILTALDIIDEMDIVKEDIDAKTKKGKALKIQFIKRLRSSLPESMVDFLDVATETSVDNVYYNTLLGSGGGNDGNLNFGSNFMQCVWLCLPDFDDQKDLRGKYKKFDSKESLKTSLFKEARGMSISGDTPGLFSPSGVGGPNAFEGYEASSLRNPWDFILTMEGTTLFAGSLARRRGTLTPEGVAFPFTCRLSPSGSESLIFSERGNRELWVPLWQDLVRFNSLKYVFREGRAEVSGRFAKDGIEFARAVASLGIDRGISRFQRFGIIRGRVGGDNYHTGAPLNTVEVPLSPREHIRLLDEIDSWMNWMERSLSDEGVAKRYNRHMREIENAIFNYCKYGGVIRLQAVLRALGRAERAFASASGGRPRPLHDLSPKWLSACNDDSLEYRLACSLASIYDSEIGPIRVQMEPVSWGSSDRFFNVWQDNRKTTEWGNRSFSKNLLAILERRLLEGTKLDLAYPPIDGRIRASLHDIQLFISGRFDESKLIDLVWALSTIKWYEYDAESDRPNFSYVRTREISRPYCFIKMIFLPGNIEYQGSGNGRWVLNRENDSGYSIRSEPGLIRLIQAGNTEEAFARATRRLVSAGLRPIVSMVPRFSIPFDQRSRLIASLLFPVWEMDTIAGYAVRKPKVHK